MASKKLGLQAHLQGGSTPPVEGKPSVSTYASQYTKTDEAMENETVQELDNKLCIPNPFQNRQKFDQDEIDALASQIKENGQQQAIGVRKKNGRYEIIFGERRWRACKALGIPVKAVIRIVSDRDMAYLCMTENAGRVRTYDFEIWVGIDNLQKLHEDEDTIRQRLCIVYEDWTKYVRFGNLPDVVKDALADSPSALGRNEAMYITNLYSANEEDAEKKKSITSELLECIKLYSRKEISSRAEIIRRLSAIAGPPKSRRKRQKVNIDHVIKHEGVPVGDMTVTPTELKLVVSKENLPKDRYDALMEVIAKFFSVEAVS